MRSAEDRETIFASARDEIVGELVLRGHPLHEAAIISDDIIDGARKIASELIAHMSGLDEASGTEVGHAAERSDSADCDGSG